MQAILDVVATAAVIGIAGVIVLGLRRAPALEAVLGSILVLLALVLAGTLSALGVFVARPERRFPTIAVGIALPFVAGLAFLNRTANLHTIPAHALIRVQVLRVAGALFLAYWWAGLLPGEFALPAGIGDVLVGLAAIPIARRLKSDPAGSHALAVAWNVAGLVDFVFAVGTGFLTSPSPFQALALDAPNRLITSFPLALIPTFAVPVFALVHVLCLSRLLERGPDRRMTPRATAT